jgi:hypothetical protein
MDGLCLFGDKYQRCLVLADVSCRISGLDNAMLGKQWPNWWRIGSAGIKKGLGI